MGTKRVSFDDSYMPNGKSRSFHIVAVYSNGKWKKQREKEGVVRRARLSDSQSPATAAKRIGKGTLTVMGIKKGDTSKSAIIAIRRHRGINGKKEKFLIYKVGWESNSKPKSFKGTVKQYAKENPMWRPYRMYARPACKLDSRKRVCKSFEEYVLTKDLGELRLA